MQYKVTVNNSEAYSAATLAGLGIAPVPQMAIEQQIASGQLVAILPNWQPQSMPVTLLIQTGVIFPDERDSLWIG